MQDLVTCMQGFDYLPFDAASTTLRTIQSAMPVSGKVVADFNSAPVARGETLTSFLRERMFRAVPLSKRLTFAKEPGAKKPGEELTATIVEMRRTALKAVFNLIEISQCVDLPQLLELRIVEECVTLFNSNGKLIQKLSLQYVDLQETFVAVVDMDMIWSIATPTTEGRRKMTPHTSVRNTCTRCHPLSLPAMAMLTVSSA